MKQISKLKESKIYFTFLAMYVIFNTCVHIYTYTGNYRLQIHKMTRLPDSEIAIRKYHLMYLRQNVSIQWIRMVI